MTLLAWPFGRRPAPRREPNPLRSVCAWTPSRAAGVHIAPRRRQANPQTDFAIETTDLVKVYGGETRTLDGISFTVALGELFGLLGPNGAGKTTAIRILSTLLTPTAGTARVQGFDVVADPREVRRRLGLAMQTPTLDAFSTGRETLKFAGRLHRMPSEETKRRTDELLELMGLASVAKKLTGTYSGGMKRRLDLQAVGVELRLLLPHHHRIDGGLLCLHHRQRFAVVAPQDVVGITNARFVRHARDFVFTILHLIERPTGALQGEVDDEPTGLACSRSGDSLHRRTRP
ncbi:MAG TPA: ABC transporter ATP-binding protein [Thermoleophilia bacterium]|nr:ABC transporter ATP-binding protein [Thermoleophilia bacterium]